jgi:hypothetical protein
MLDFHLAGTSRTNGLRNTSGWLRVSFDRLAAATTEGKMHLADGVGVQRMTRTLGVSAKVSRHPFRELSVCLSLDDLIGHHL